MFDSINHALTQLTFIRPWAFFLLLPAAALFLWQYTQPHHSTNWAKLIDKHLLDWIVPNTRNHKSHKRNHYLPLLFWLLGTLALSGPSWEKLPNPIYSNQNASVIVLDLSRSMKAKDIQPSRLTRAKHKIADILKSSESGQTGLVVYAGDGFILSPLTSDKKTIENLLAPLSPALMPLLGSQPQKGIEKAITLLTNAQQPRGTIIWITDGAESHQLKDIESLLEGTRYQLRILAVGTAQGSPIPMESGRYLRDSNNNLIVPKLHYDELAKFADKTQSILTPVTANNDDVELLLAQYMLLDDDFKKEDLFSDTWHDAGYWLIFLMLPIALYAFRQKGLIAMLVLNGLLISSYSSPTMAESPDKTSIADKLFLNQDQRAQKHFEQKKYQDAQSNFRNKRWKAAAAYKNKDYDSAIRLSDNPKTASDYYNRANAHAFNENYQGAIDEYKKALEIEPEHSDSMHNKKIIEQLLQQQKKQDEQKKKEQEEQKKKDNQQKQDSDQDSKDPQKDEKQKKPKEQQSDKQEQEEKQNKEPQEAEMKELTEQEKEQEIEQLLKRINDDPGRLLRNKMRLEYNRRGSHHAPDKTW